MSATVGSAIASQDSDEVRQRILHKGELALSLRATEGEWPHEVRTVARALSALDGLLREIAKSVAPTEKLTVVLVRVDILDEVIKFTVRVDPARPRRRRKVAA